MNCDAAQTVDSVQTVDQTDGTRRRLLHEATTYNDNRPEERWTPRKLVLRPPPQRPRRKLELSTPMPTHKLEPRARFKLEPPRKLEPGTFAAAAAAATATQTADADAQTRTENGGDQKGVCAKSGTSYQPLGPIAVML